MKPDIRTAMQNLIFEIHKSIPFNTPNTDMCADDSSCQGCSMKLLEYLSIELQNWQQRLDDGETPNFGDLARLEKTGKTIHKTLKRNGLINTR